MNPPFPQQLPRSGSWSRPIANPAPIVRETAIVSAALGLYLFVRGLIRGREAAAFDHATRLIDLERRLGIFWEPRLQAWALAHSWLVTVTNWIYVWTYWPLLIGTMIWLFVRHREAVAVFRNALLISGAIGLVCFAVFPLAPPRFLSAWGFVDTVATGSDAYAALYPASVANWYAAMPSLHVGWTLLMGIALATRSTNRLVRAVGIVLPPAMYAATVMTANHYLADGLVGAAVALVGLGCAWMLRCRPSGMRSK
jgi:PAP2 superfamily protein